MSGQVPGAPRAAHLGGADPFRASDGTVPYLARLREARVRPTPGEAPGNPSALAAAPDLGPPVPEVALEDPQPRDSWFDRVAGLLLDRDEERRLEAAAARLGAGAYDRLGLSMQTCRRTLALFKLLHRYYFRVESSGHAQIPEKGSAILAGNHGGLLPFDAAMAVVDVCLRAESPRLVRTIVERWVGSLPFLNVFYSRVGQVIGTRENFRELLRGQELVLVFPEGVDGIRKRAADRYVLQPFHVGFVEESIRNRAPIVPVAFIGADDQAPILYDVKPLAKLLQLPVFPVTPTFPLLGPLGLLPYPVRYEIEYGEPFRFFEEHPPSVIGNPQAVREMVEQVRGRIQSMVDRRLRARRGRER